MQRVTVSFDTWIQLFVMMFLRNQILKALILLKLLTPIIRKFSLAIAMI